VGAPTASSRYRYPVVLGPSDRTFWTISATALASAALLDYPARDAIHGYRTPFLDRLAPLGDVFGTAKYTVPTVTAALVVAHLSHNANWEDVTRHITMSYVLGDLTEALLKGGVGRQRPDYTGSAWRFQPLSLSEEWHSFPSGHVTHITAIAAAFAEEAHRPWVTAVATGAVALTGWQRIYRDQHWASDVIGGVIVGVAASRVTAHWLRHKRKN
jgi:membrane-associated phospholipid phosphatase